MHLIPAPKHTTRHPGTYTLLADVFIVLPPHADHARNLFAAERFKAEAEHLMRAQLHIAPGAGVDAAREIRAVFDEGLGAELPEAIRNQAYRLSIRKAGVTLAARAPAGLFYAFQTLLQMIRAAAYQAENRKGKRENRKALRLPCLSIWDHPDFARRGVYHDTARGKVPTVDTLLQLIDDLAHLKYNEFQLYIENNFQFRRHPEMYADTDPFTAEELLLLDAACRARHMDFVPSLTSLGHFEKILARPKYRHLAEAEPAQLKAIGAPCWHDAGPWSLCVTDPGAKKLLAEMYAEFAPNFPSSQFNICCDEAYDLGRVRSKQLADKIGRGQLYVDWINFCDRLVKSHGSHKSIQLWGDIILHHPDLIGQLPADATLLEWGYERDHPFEEHCAAIAENGKWKRENRKRNTPGRGGRAFYVAPGTSSWLTFAGRTKNALGNIHTAAREGLKHGAKGILVTDWGDYGHQQMLGVSLLPFAYGAAAGWNLHATPDPMQGETKPGTQAVKHISSFSIRQSAFLRSISFHLFQDRSAQFALLAYELGLTYERLGWQRRNASLEFFLFREKWDVANYVNRVSAAALRKTITKAEKLYGRMHQTQSRRGDATLLVDEFFLTCHLIIHTCRRTLLRKQWLAADPARRNADDPILCKEAPVPLPKDFGKQMRFLGDEIVRWEGLFSTYWLARNKRSRLADVVAEFARLAGEYRRFGR